MVRSQKSYRWHTRCCIGITKKSAIVLLLGFRQLCLFNNEYFIP